MTHIYTNDRDAYRQVFFTAWQKYQHRLPIEPIETHLIDIMLLHEEYHALLNKPHAYQHQAFSLEDNPFFHMSLHLAIREQVHTNRPVGIASIHDQLIIKDQDTHHVEHSMMNCLAQMMWQAQQTGVMPSDEVYLEKLRELCRVE